MPPTLKDIASRANVSPALVSMYLNKNPKSRMSAETRQRIDAAIREMNYHPSALARSLRSGKSMTIGYATGNIVGTFSSFQTQMLLLEAYRYGYQLLISLVPFYDLAQEQKILNNLLDSQPAGILYNLDLKPAVILSAGSLPGALAGVWVNLLIPEDVMRMILYIVVLASGISILLRKDGKTDGPETGDGRAGDGWPGY